MKKEIRNKKINNPKGFSLIETIVAVFLITVGLIASVDLITKGLRESMDSRDQLIAAELAQEGIELVRNVRDNNWLAAADSFLHIAVADNCRIDKDYSYPADVSCSSESKRLYVDAQGFYVHTSSSSATKFYRKLIIADNGEARGITSMVVWNNNGNFPAITSGCNTAAKCAYTETVLSKWGDGIIK